MEFNKSNREALITNLRESNEILRIKIEVHKQMEEQHNTVDVLWQLVEIESLKVSIKMIEKALIDNNPFNLDVDFCE
jgi:hypothetical protein